MNIKKGFFIVFVIFVFLFDCYAKRIVSLSPSMTEIIFAINAQEYLVCRTDFCDYPEEVTQIPSCGGFDAKTISLEKIISFSPNLVLLVNGMHNHYISTLKKLNIDYYISDVKSIEDLFSEILSIGKLCNRKLESEICVSNLQQRLNKIKTSVDNLQLKNKLKIFWQVDYSPYITVGKNSFVNDIIESLCCINIFNEIDISYPVISEESIILKNPDIIIIPTYDNQNIKIKKLWKNISAVKNNNIYYVDADIASRSSPRFIDCIEYMAKMIYNIY